MGTRQGRLAPYYFVLPALIGLLIFRVLPIVVSMAGSFTNQTLLGDTVLVGFDNYIALFVDAAFWKSLALTVLFNLLINPIQLAIGLGLALLVFPKTPGVGVFRTMYFLPFTASIVVASILWMLLLDPSLGMVNAILKSVGIPAQSFLSSKAGTARTR